MASTTEYSSLTERFDLSSPKQARFFQPSLTAATEETSMPEIIPQLYRLDSNLGELIFSFYSSKEVIYFLSSLMTLVQLSEQLPTPTFKAI